MQLKFLINKKYIFLHAINQCQPKEPFQGWADFTLKKWDKYPQECYFLAGFAEWLLLNKKSIKETANNSKKLLEKWLEEPLIKRLLKETEEYHVWLKKEWDKKGKKALNELEDITKMPLPKKQISVYVTHPKLNNGICLSPDIICWGHEEEWENYSIVYLCHEILPTMFWEDNSEIIHSVIELATDNELRIRLQKKGKYFETKTDRKILKKIYPKWINYLKNNNQNLKEFIQELK